MAKKEQQHQDLITKQAKQAKQAKQIAKQATQLLERDGSSKILEQKIDALIKRIFGKSSEKLTPEEQLLLFESNETEPLIQAPMAAPLILGTHCVPGLAAYLVVSKYCDHLPQYQPEYILRLTSHLYQIEIKLRNQGAGPRLREAVRSHQAWDKELVVLWRGRCGADAGHTSAKLYRIIENCKRPRPQPRSLSERSPHPSTSESHPRGSRLADPKRHRKR